jgi:hypothetical protein
VFRGASTHCIGDIAPLSTKPGPECPSQGRPALYKSGLVSTNPSEIKVPAKADWTDRKGRSLSLDRKQAFDRESSLSHENRSVIELAEAEG